MNKRIWDLREQIGQENTREVINLAERIKPILSGNPPANIGGALTDLIAMWIAGHIVPGDPKSTDELQKEVLKLHIQIVKELIPINAKIIEASNADIV